MVAKIIRHEIRVIKINQSKSPLEIQKDKRFKYLTIEKSGTTHEILNDVPFLNAHNLVHIHRHIHEGKEHVHPHLPLEEHP